MVTIVLPCLPNAAMLLESGNNNGWYVVYNMTEDGYHAPKRLELVIFNVPRTKHVPMVSCWPAGRGGATCAAARQDALLCIPIHMYRDAD